MRCAHAGALTARRSGCTLLTSGITGRVAMSKWSPTRRRFAERSSSKPTPAACVPSLRTAPLCSRVQPRMRDLPLTYERADGFMRGGTVISVTQQLVVVRSPGLTPGDVVRAQRRDRSELLAEVTTADTFGARCTPLGSVDGLEVGASVRCDLARLGVYSGASLLGCMADAWGRVERVGRQERSPSVRVVPLDQSGVSLRSRAPICAMMRTGVPAIDMFATLGYGQRVSLTAGAGVGKSRVLQRIADHADVDARVVALVGERGREAAEMCERVRASPNARTTT